MGTVIIVTILLVLAQVLYLSFAFYLLKIIKSGTFANALEILNKLIKTLFIMQILFTAISTVLLAIEFLTSELILVVIAQSAISIYFTLLILNYSLKLTRNLQNDKIYCKENSKYLLEISKALIYSSIVNGIAGIALAFICNIANYPNFDYTITLSSTFIFNLMLGLVFYIISLLFDRSIEIYEENQLTI